MLDLRMILDRRILCSRPDLRSNRFGSRLFSREEPHEEKLDDVRVYEQKLCSSIALSTSLRV